ncbi:MAG: acetylneuraminic acid synthetase, partial [Planctomycetaceae bacterium]|nr:acetylneuraminic acid synthetase [Planctomycetaceae bacterium]
ERSTSTRSLVLRTNVSAGHRIDPKDLKIVRPGNGIAPKYLDVVQGMTTSTNLDANTVLQWEMFK